MGGSLSVESALPYPWPFDVSVAGSALAVVVAGHDRRWPGRCEFDPALDSRLVALVDACVSIGALAVALEHIGPEVGASTEARAPIALRNVVVATTFGVDGFFGGGLDATLRAAGRTHLVVCGYGLEGPVHSTLRSANDRGYECLLVADASASLALNLRDAAVSTVTMSGGIFGAVGDTASVLAGLALEVSSPTNLGGSTS